MGQRNFKKHFELYNFSEILYCGITRLRNMNLSVYAMSIHKNHLKKQKYGTESV